MTKEVDFFYHLTVEDIEKRKQKGENVPWDGKALSLRRYIISWTPDSEEFLIKIELVISSYYYTYTAIKHLNDMYPVT